MSTTVVQEPRSEGKLGKEELLRMHDLMLRARILEERLIRMQKQGDGYFWIGGPGEEAFNVALGMLVHKGEGLDYDYLHLHYRSSATMLAMGADPMDSMRQMKSTATDPYSGGRNFVNHYSIKKWNVVPVSSPIEVQYSMAPGTAYAQKRHGGKGLTIVQGGDAGTAEGDFATCLIWASRPGFELPMLIIVTNNQYGISTPAGTQHGERHIADRGKAFGMKTGVIDGNDPELAYAGIKDAMDYVRKERKPFVLEAMVSRLYGHSSSSGANYVTEEADCITQFEKKLEQAGHLSRAQADALKKSITDEYLEMSKKVREEPQPEGKVAFEHIFREADPAKNKANGSSSNGGH
ncbi:MAG TPA: thiamine pyrophosphate-dependent dehydrogenase E1 component subunit alpha [Polyangiaceae bacterium]